MDVDLYRLGTRLLALSARRGASPETASALIGCGAVLIHRVVPNEDRVMRALAALRLLGAEQEIERDLLRALSSGRA